MKVPRFFYGYFLRTNLGVFENKSDHIGMLLQVLKEHQLFYRYIKCEFWLMSVEFICYMICSDGVKIGPKKIKEVRN